MDFLTSTESEVSSFSCYDNGGIRVKIKCEEGLYKLACVLNWDKLPLSVAGFVLDVPQPGVLLSAGFYPRLSGRQLIILALAVQENVEPDEAIIYFFQSPFPFCTMSPHERNYLFSLPCLNSRYFEPIHQRKLIALNDICDLSWSFVLNSVTQQTNCVELRMAVRVHYSSLPFHMRAFFLSLTDEVLLTGLRLKSPISTSTSALADFIFIGEGKAKDWLRFRGKVLGAIYVLFTGVANSITHDVKFFKTHLSRRKKRETKITVTGTFLL